MDPKPPMSTASLVPYPGLRSFQADEDYLFFGREEQTTELLGLLKASRFIAVVGTSGSGKSSLVRAGLLPALHGGIMTQAGSHWDVVVMKPGSDPVTHLARALIEAGLYPEEDPETLLRVRATLSRSRFGLIEAVRQSSIHGSNVLVVVDQFEELFRFRSKDVDSKDAAAAFVKLLLSASEAAETPVYVVITMRSDYLGDCAQISGLARAVNQGEYLVPQLTRNQRRDAIEKPALVGGARMAPRLAQQLLNDVGDDQDQLPIMQHALMRMWHYWKAQPKPGGGSVESPVLDLDHYEAIGGVREALSRHADEVYESLPDERHRAAAQKVFMALTERGLDNRGVRRPARFDLLCAVVGGDEATVKAVIEAFRAPGRTFLMPLPGTSIGPETIIDISHESLMRVWGRLRRWVDEEAQSARIYQRLAETAQLHADGKAGLYHDPDLQVALSWRAAQQPSEAWGRRYHEQFEQAVAFLEASRIEAERAAREREAARQHELEQARALAEARQRTARLFKRFGLAMGGVAVVALIAFVAALKARQEASRQARVAEAARKEATHLAREAGEILMTSRHEEGRTWLVKAESMLEQRDLFGARMMAGRAMGYQGLGRSQQDEAFGRQFPVLLKTNSAEALKAAALIHQLDPLEPVYRGPSLRHHSIAVRDLELMDGGETIVSIGDGFNVSFWDRTTGNLKRDLIAQNNFGRTQFLEIMPSEKAVLVGSRGGAIVFLDLESGAVTNVWRVRIEGFEGMDLSPDGSLLAVAGRLGTAWGLGVLTMSNLTERFMIEHPASIEAMAFDPKSERIVTLAGLTLRGWNARTGQPAFEPMRMAPTQSGGPVQLAFNPDGSLLALSMFPPSGRGQRLLLLNTATWEEQGRLRLPFNEGILTAMAFSRDGSRIALAYGGGSSVELWDVTSRKLLETFEGPDLGVTLKGNLRFSPDARFLWSGGADGAIRCLDLQEKRILGQASGRYLWGRSLGFGFSWDGSRLISGAGRIYRELDVTDGRVAHEEFLDFEPSSPLSDPSWMVRSGDPVEIYRLVEGKHTLVASLDSQPEQGTVNNFSVMVDGSVMALARSNGQIEFYDTASWKLAASFKAHTDSHAVAMHQNEMLLLTAGTDGLTSTLRIWGSTNGVFAPMALTNLLLELPGLTRGEFPMLSEDGSKVIIQGSGIVPGLRLLDLTKGLEPQFFDPESRAVIGDLSPDGATLATTAQDSDMIQLWDTGTRQIKARLPLGTRPRLPLGTRRQIPMLDISPDGRLLAAMDAEGHIEVWSLGAGIPSRPPAQTLRAHQDRVFAVAYGPTKDWLASAGMDGLIMLWTNRTGHVTGGPLLATTQTWYSVAISPDGRHLAAGSRSPEGWIYLFDTASGQVRHRVQGLKGIVNSAGPPEYKGIIWDLRFSPDSSMLAAAGEWAPLRLWSVNSGEMVTELPTGEGGGEGVMALQFSPDGAELAAGGGPRICYRWIHDAGGWKLFDSVKLAGTVRGVFYSPQQPTLWLYSGRSQAVGVFSEWPSGRASRASPTARAATSSTLGAGAPIREFKDSLDVVQMPPGRDELCSNAAMSPSGRLLASTTQSGVLTLLDSATGQIVASFQAHEGEARGVAFSPDGTTLATSGDDQVVRLWNVEALLSDPADYASLVRYVAPEGRALEWKLPASETNLYEPAYMPWRTNLNLHSAVASGPEASIEDRDARLLSRVLDAGNFVAGRVIWNRLPEARRRPEDRAALGRLALESRKKALATYAVAMTQTGHSNLALPWLQMLAVLNVSQELERIPLITATNPVPALEQLLVLDTATMRNVELVPEGSVWRYFDQGTDPGSGWKNPDFDDRTWASGPAPLGFGDPVVTTIARRDAAGNNYITAYFRHAFHVTNLSAVPIPSLKLRRDDGAVVYLNGREVLRDNMPETAITPTTLSARSINSAAVGKFDVESPGIVSGLKAGKNVVAVEIHQSSLVSSDLLLELEFSSERTSGTYFALLPAEELQRILDRVMTVLPEELQGQWAARFRFAWSPVPGTVPESLAGNLDAWILRSRVQTFLAKVEEARQATATSLRLIAESPRHVRHQLLLRQQQLASRFQQ